MADRGDTHYFVPRLNVWFLWSSALLLLSIVWMMWDDYNAPWKAYQREFREIEIERAQAALDSPASRAAMEEETRLEAELERAQAALVARADEIQRLERDLIAARGEQFAITEAAKKVKQEYNWDRYLAEEHRIHAIEKGDAIDEEELERLLAIEEELSDAERKQEDADLAVAAIQAQLAAAHEHVSDLEIRTKAATKDIALVRTRLETLRPTTVGGRIAAAIRDDIPGLDFIGPTLKVQKVVLDDLTFDLNFTKKKRIDMCMTCHVASDRDGFTEEGLEEPFRSHPRLDLFLTAKSAHPLNQVGCTICHRGGGEALDFIRSDHRPADFNTGLAYAEQPITEAWVEEYHWHKQHHWDWPMLASQYVEASCVQCHKTTMDLIAPDAPKVAAGYEKFERYGCYSCHKVDWFPTKRKPGPSLKNIAQKVDVDWMAAWIADPKAFRPTTWMPQFFYLSNFPNDEPVVAQSEFGKGPPVMGQQWNDTAVAAVTAYIMSQSADAPLAAIPVEGDGERGREVFRVIGCGACHNLAPYPGEEAEVQDPLLVANDANEHGPNLRGIATKVSPEWLFAWLKDPHAYWSETRMPDLRLSDQDAADIVAYMMDDPDGYFRDVPEGWQEGVPTVDPAALAEQARWFFARDGRGVIESRLRGEDPNRPWDDPMALLVEVGERFVRHQGCFSCHEVTGMEHEMPIGTELTNWGSKTVDKLDWGFRANLLAAEHGWGQVQREQLKKYREPWLEEKLHQPRVFDEMKVKNPLERLRMPWFDLETEEVQEIATFVVGLVNDEVERAKMIPTPAEASMNDGLQALRQNNCASCHVLDHGTVTFRDAAGEVHTVEAELLPFSPEEMPPPQASLEAFLAEVAAYEEDVEELRDIGFRLLGPAPGVGMASETVFVQPDDLIAVTPPVGGDFVRVITDYYLRGIELHDAEADEFYGWWLSEEDAAVEDVDGELRSYIEEGYLKVRWTFAPPLLVDEGAKVQRNWFYAFLKDPVSLRQQMRVRMPTFHYGPGEAESIADYFAHHSAERWKAVYAKTLRLALGTQTKESFDPAAMGRPALPWPEMAGQKAGGVGITLEEMSERTKLGVDTLRELEAGYAPTVAAQFNVLKAYGDSVGFQVHGPVDASYERVERRAPSHLAANEPRIAIGHQLATKDVNCFQCHFDNGADPEQVSTPIAWAPDLALTRERLREDWVQRWLWLPSLEYPGTAMPANFGAEEPQYQETFPDSTNHEQVQAVLDWLYNYDRATSAARN